MQVFTVDAFAVRPFTGNPAAVCILDEPRADTWLQSLAQEINYSETAFLTRSEQEWELRWFTPAFEVDLCGHATLASAHVIWNELNNSSPTLRFQTRSGVLTASRESDWIQLDFPATPPTACLADPRLLEALQIEPKLVGKSKFDAFIVADNEQQVRDLKPNFKLLSQLPVRGIIVTALADKVNASSGDETNQDYDFISRFFAPAAGIDEDPVTGSAHCCLAPYWSSELGRKKLTGYQASPRGGWVGTQVVGERVYLRGQAITVLRGNLDID